MIYLDTHVVAWLYQGDITRISVPLKTLLSENEIFISPLVILELTYLYEIKRVTIPSYQVIAHLQEKIDLQVCQQPFIKIIQEATRQIWTRDPFDRIIVAQAAITQGV